MTRYDTPNQFGAKVTQMFRSTQKAQRLILEGVGRFQPMLHNLP